MLAWIKNKFGLVTVSTEFDFDAATALATINDQDCSTEMDVYLTPDICFLQVKCGEQFGLPIETGDECIVGECLVGHPLD